jgi:hypothetical protein
VHCARPELLPLANAVVLVAASVVDGHERLFESVHDGIVALFVCELLARLRTHGWQFLRRPLSAFDAAVILVSAMPALGVDASLLRLARGPPSAFRQAYRASEAAAVRTTSRPRARRASRGTPLPSLPAPDAGAICSSVIWI